MTKLHDLQSHGQSVWLDYLDRNLIQNGELEAWVDKGVCGVTSNPSIFYKALQNSDAYESQFIDLLESNNHSTEAIYEALVIKDIQDASDILRPVYERTSQRDGFVSLEVSPELAYDTDGTIEAVHRLHKRVNRPNVMFKVPATREGIPAIERLLAEGININITLMFSMQHYEAVAKAYIAGLNHFGMDGGDVSTVASVASFFVSRIDVKLDDWFESLGEEQLQGKIGIANAKCVYQRFQEIFMSEPWQSLASQGARPQRVLWGSTSVKNPDYPETLYVDNLIGKDTVNTLPPDTIEAFLKKGTVTADTVQQKLEEANEQIQKVEELEINLDEVSEQLQREGVGKFDESYRSLLGLLEGQRQKLAKQIESQ